MSVGAAITEGPIDPNVPGSQTSPFADNATANAAAAVQIAAGIPPTPLVLIGSGTGATQKTWDGGAYGPRTAANYPALIAQPAPTVLFSETRIPKLAATGNIRMVWDGSSWTPMMAASSIVDLTDPASNVAPGDTANHDTTLFTIPGGMWRDGDTWRTQFVFETWLSNTGSDTMTIFIGGVLYISLAMSTNTLQPMIMDFRRAGSVLRRSMIILTTGISATNPGDYAINMASDKTVVCRIAAANGANKTYLRRFSMVRN